ncbi:hypothetical protein CYMTET_39766 [Cymbomonas tetramitiformis]|uniref:Uncharacterized protein n=1 Tax=Cymbomonas tetramitiformis TaxID=36881 RepID=A0AAE0C9H6_9CHLO|nr:hypothetical protein CYMTET_39766 [Cymbomonas tetramitiformis]
MQEEERQLECAEKEERQAKAAVEKAKRTQDKELERIAIAQRKEQRDAKKATAVAAQHARNAASARLLFPGRVRRPAGGGVVPGFRPVLRMWEDASVNNGATPSPSEPEAAFLEAQSANFSLQMG